MDIYKRRLLRVNLSNGEIREEDIPLNIVMNFLGGRGLGIKYLYDELAPFTDPLSPENKLLLITGPLAGTGAQSTSRWIAASKSPLTNTYTRAVGGGDFGAWLRFLGFDLIILEGKASEPSYLYLEKENYKILPAKELWGQDTQKAQLSLKERHGERTKTIAIGVAGEKLVRYAGIFSQRRSASRGGVGAVMGSKNLKAIAINCPARATVYDRDKMKELIEEEIISFKSAIPSLFEPFSMAGTPSMVEAANAMGLYPVKNFREGTLADFPKIGVNEYMKIKIKDTGCYSCMIHCGNIFKLNSGPYKGVENEGPEYESIWAFTGTIGANDIGATVMADCLCDDLGIDTISCGVVIGFVYELYEKGILTSKDLDGLTPTYGNWEVMIELIKMIGQRKGIGDILAEGVKRAAERIGQGSERYAIHAKGQELPAYDPRAAKAQALSYATSNVGGNHCIGYASQEIFGSPIPRPVDRFSEKDKGDIAKFNQDMTTLLELGIVCTFPGGFGWISPLLLGKMLFATTGREEFAVPGYLFRVAERVYNLERAFNIREGFKRKDDTLPQRFFTEPLRNAGPSEGAVIRDFEGMLDDYYKARGWTEKGVPSKEKLAELGLEEIEADLEKQY